MEGSGNSNKQISYSFIDSEPLNSGNYYRLKQVDFNGTFSYSPTEYVVFESDQLNFTVRPNPVTGDSFEVMINNAEDGILSIYDSFGNLVIHVPILVQSNRIVSVEELKSGIYILHFKGKTKSHSEKIVVSR